MGKQLGNGQTALPPKERKAKRTVHALQGGPHAFGAPGVRGATSARYAAHVSGMGRWRPFRCMRTRFVTPASCNMTPKEDPTPLTHEASSCPALR